MLTQREPAHRDLVVPKNSEESSTVTNMHRRTQQSRPSIRANPANGSWSNASEDRPPSSNPRFPTTPTSDSGKNPYDIGLKPLPRSEDQFCSGHSEVSLPDAPTPMSSIQTYRHHSEEALQQRDSGTLFSHRMPDDLKFDKHDGVEVLQESHSIKITMSQDKRNNGENSNSERGSDRHYPTAATIEDNLRSNILYERHLSLKGHGHPLWIPQPNMRLPISYRTRGVSIGDVGIFTPDGGFDFLFNICTPAGNSLNPKDLPDGFSPIHPPLEPVDIREFREFQEGSYLASSAVAKSNSDTTKSRGLMFEPTGTEGAILIMPTGAYREDLNNVLTFRQQIESNAESWYRFAIGPRGRDIENGDLRLITGCDKSSTWGMATFVNDAERDDIYLDFKPSVVGAECRHKWDHFGPFDVKTGPGKDENHDLQLSPQAVAPCNQCLFLRSFSIKLSQDVWEKLRDDTIHPDEITESCRQSRVKVNNDIDAITVDTPEMVVQSVSTDDVIRGKQKRSRPLSELENSNDEPAPKKKKKGERRNSKQSEEYAYSFPASNIGVCHGRPTLPLVHRWRLWRGRNGTIAVRSRYFKGTFMGLHRCLPHQFNEDLCGHPGSNADTSSKKATVYNPIKEQRSRTTRLFDLRLASTISQTDHTNIENLLNVYLLRKIPQAKMAVTGDNDLCSILELVSRNLQVPEILSAVLMHNDICESNGMAYFESKEEFDTKTLGFLSPLYNGKKTLENYLFGTSENRAVLIADLLPQYMSIPSSEEAPIPNKLFLLQGHPMRTLSLNEIVMIFSAPPNTEITIERIRTIRKRLASYMQEHPYRAMLCIHQLAHALLRRFYTAQKPRVRKDDLDEAIWYLEQYIKHEHVGEDDYFYLEAILNLCSALHSRIQLLGCNEDRERLIELLKIQRQMDATKILKPLNDLLHQVRTVDLLK